MSTYEAGKKALTNVLSDKRLDVDNVTDTMLDIQEVIRKLAKYYIHFKLHVFKNIFCMCILAFGTTLRCHCGPVATCN